SLSLHDALPIFLALALVARDDAGDDRLLCHRCRDAHLDVVLDTEPPAPRRVVDLNRRRGDAEDVALLPDPGRVPLDVAAEPPEEDAFERGPLFVVATLVDVE